MTSRRSLPDNIIKTQKNIMRERFWQLILVLLIFTVYFIGGGATAVFFARNALDSGSLTDNLKSATNIVFGPYLSPVTLSVMAVFSSILGYNYLYSRQKVDFYESHPVGRVFRWWNIYVYGIAIVIIPYIVTCFLGYGFISIIGYTDFETLSLALSTALKSVVFYVAVYSITTLSAMLSGNIVIAFLGTIVLHFYYDDLKLVLNGLSSIMYVTYSSIQFNEGFFERFTPDPFVNFYNSHGIEGTLVNLCIALIITIVSCILFIYRKNEMIGSSIVFKTARTIIKIALAVIWTLNIAWFYLMSANRNISSTIILFVDFAVIISAVLVSIMLEGILSLNARACFKNFFHSFIVAAIALIVIQIFYFDITGYDSYLPSISKVESYGISRSNYLNYYDENLVECTQEEYVYKNMILKDHEALNILAELSLSNTLELKKSRGAVNGYNTTFIYRLKNGRTVVRNLIIPYSIDRYLMDKIIGSNEYKDGYFPHKHTEAFTEKFKRNMNLRYDYGNDCPSTNEDVEKKYSELLEAYEKDLALYNYSEEKDEASLGIIYLEGNINNPENYAYGEISLPIYENYSNSIEFLKKNNLWVNNTISSDTIRSATVTDYGESEYMDVYGNYVSKSVLEQSDAEDLAEDREEMSEDLKDDSEDLWDTDETTSVEYTEKDKLEKICESVYVSENPGVWENSYDENTHYSVLLYSGDSNDYDADVLVCRFRKDQIPSFVTDDLSKN